MGSDRAKLIARCCYAAVSLIALTAMLWIAWCLFGLTAVQVSEAQRRALVHYSPTPKPLATSTTPATEETSASNAISKLPTTASLEPKRKDLAKGDFSPRDRGAHNATADSGDDSKLPRGPPVKPHLGPEEKVVVVTSSSQGDSQEDHVHARRVFSPGTENRPEEKDSQRKPAEPAPDDISPTRVHDASGESLKHGDRSRVEARTDSRVYSNRDQSDLPRRDDIQSSLRSGPESVDRDPNFDREEPRRRLSLLDQSRHGYEDEIDDEKRSRGRYDGKDRGRGSGDRYSKGDTRVYPNDDKDLPSESGDRSRKGDDDDRYDVRSEDNDKRPRPSDWDKDRYRNEERHISRNDDRYRDRDDERHRYRVEERYRSRDDDRHRGRDEDRHRDRDEDRHRDRDEDRHRDRDEDRHRDRDDERHTFRDDDGYRARDDERYRYRDDDRYRLSDDDRRRSRDDENHRVREDDRHTLREDERYRTDDTGRRDSPRRFNDDREGSRPWVDDKYVDTSIPVLRATYEKEIPSRSSSDLTGGARKPTSSRYEYNLRSEETVTDYDIPVRDSSRSREGTSRLPRPTYDEEERYRERRREDDRRRPPRYENDRMEISPTRTREESLLSRSSSIDSRPKGPSDDSHRDRSRDDDRYYDADRTRSTSVQDSRSSFSPDESSRRYIDDRDKYRTRLPNERTGDSRLSNRREEVVLDRRSYASEDEYRKDSRRSNDDRDRRPVDDTRRRYENDESYSRRDQIDVDEYKSRTSSDYDRNRSRSRDRYDDDYRRYDDRYDDRYSSRGDHSVPLPVRRYDTYPDEDKKPRRRDPDPSNLRIESSRDRGENLRSISSTKDEERSYGRDEYTDFRPSVPRRYDEDSSVSNSRDSYPESRRYSERPSRATSTREPTLGSSMTSSYSREPSDVVVREKRFQSTQDGSQSSRVLGDEALKDDAGRPRGQILPMSAKDVIEAANRQSDASDPNARKVYYPVFDPRLSNLTSPDIIRPSERRGTTITVRKRRSA